MKRLHAGDVVRAEFFKDKIRPGVVVGNDAYEHITVLVCPMSSELLNSPLRPRIEPGGNGLTRVSEIMPHRLQALPHQRIHKVVGRLTAGQLRRLEDLLLDVLGLRDACKRLR